MISLSEKYAPKKVADIISQNTAVMQMLEYLDNFKSQKKKALIIHGPTGTGKSSSVYAIAKDLNYDIVELNATDFRNKDIIETMISTTVKTGSLFGKRKMVFIDEAETFTSKDRGGIAALVKVIKETRIPIVLVVFDIWDQKIRALKPYANAIEFKKVRYDSIDRYMKKILEKEGIEYDDVVTEFIAKNANGDIRAALNDLEIIATGKKKITKEDIIFFEDRPKEEKIFTAVQKIFKTTNLQESREVFNNINMDFSLFSLWISDNIVNEYEKPHERAKAYNYASRSDIFTGRIRRRQSWSLYKYAIDLITAGVSSAKDEKYNKFSRYNPPTKITKLYQTKSKRTLKKKVCQKLASELHTSSKKVEEHYLPFLKAIIKDKATKKNISENLILEKEELSFLGKGM